MKNSIFLGFVTGLAILVYLNWGKESRPGNPEDKTEQVKTLKPLETSQESSEGGVADSDESSAGFAPVASAELSQDLAREIQKAKAALPTLESLRTVSDDEEHGTPSKIVEAGAALGDLDEYLEGKPEEFKNATGFFSDCAMGETLPSSVRAMCLHSLRRNPTEWAPGVSAKLEKIPSDVVDLEAQL